MPLLRRKRLKNLANLFSARPSLSLHGDNLRCGTFEETMAAFIENMGIIAIEQHLRC
jgi:hypothetical protein